MKPEMTSLVFLQYLTTVFDNIEDAILLIEVAPQEHFRLLMANEGFFRNTGHQRSVIGMTVKDAMPDTEGYVHLARQYKKAVDNKKPHDFTHWYVVPKGRRAFHVKIIPLLNAIGEVVQLAVITRNVTEIEELRQKVTDATRTLETISTKLHTPHDFAEE